MDRPKCQRFPCCGKRHFLTEPCATKDNPAESISREARKGGTTPDALPKVAGPSSREADSAVLTQVERNRRWRERNPDRHKKYQREYMRKKRSGK